MRTFLSFVGLALAGCGGLPTDATPTQVRDAQPLLAATSTTSNAKVPVAVLTFVPCAIGGTGEFVLAIGTLHILTHVTVSNAGNTHIKVHFQPQGLSGTGLTSGDTYRATGVTQQITNFNGNPPANFTFINNFRFIGPGPDNNLAVHQTIHVTVNANGDITATVNNTSITCK
ncbi:MAG: hypothetical protein ACT4P7_22875 [Gemmatimonadaceae bacterium]